MSNRNEEILVPADGELPEDVLAEYPVTEPSETLPPIVLFRIGMIIFVFIVVPVHIKVAMAPFAILLILGLIASAESEI
ncbi:MAG: hypothetical protein L0154_16840 [Chloroflexi bacterium]|nr:hypothetical protein [Chloroflexota bacterium]